MIKIVFFLLVVCVAFSAFTMTKTLKKDMEIKEKCTSYAFFDNEYSLWRWQPELSFKFFPTKDDTIRNCVAYYRY